MVCVDSHFRPRVTEKRNNYYYRWLIDFNIGNLIRLPIGRSNRSSRTPLPPLSNCPTKENAQNKSNHRAQLTHTHTLWYVSIKHTLQLNRRNFIFDMLNVIFQAVNTCLESWRCRAYKKWFEGLLTRRQTSARHRLRRRHILQKLRSDTRSALIVRYIRS